MGFHIILEKKGPFLPTVINIPSERLRVKSYHTEDIRSARPQGHKISTGTSGRYKPLGTVAWHPVRVPRLSAGPPTGWWVLPSP